MVKRFMRKESEGPEVPQGLPLTEEQIRALGSAKMKTVGKALKPSDQEVELNPRSRSSVLRVAENCRGLLCLVSRRRASRSKLPSIY